MMDSDTPSRQWEQDDRNWDFLVHPLDDLGWHPGSHPVAENGMTHAFNRYIGAWQSTGDASVPTPPFDSFNTTLPSVLLASEPWVYIPETLSVPLTGFDKDAQALEHFQNECMSK